MIAATMDSTAYLTRQDILKFPFPYKLWLVVHLEVCDFLRWNRDGTVILLDLIALEMYLNSNRSIFNIKNRSVFLHHLEQFQFERLNALPEAEEDLLLQYKHENFQRHRLDLLAKIRRHTYQLIGEPPQLNAKHDETTIAMDNFCDSDNKSNDNGAEKLLSQRVNQRMLGDLCFMSHGGLSNIQKQRLRFQTILNFQHEARILQAKLQASDEHAAAQQVQQRRGSKQEVTAARNSDMPPPPPPSISTVTSEDEQVIELPVELFENPHDSVLHLGDDFRPEYAGYYGNCNKDQIVHFFGDYLPMYEDGSMEVKKIVADFSASTAAAANYTNNRNGDIMHMENDGYEFNMQTTSTPLAAKSMSGLNLSSTLQPIFKTDEEEVADHFAANESEIDISMDEFIKFKKNPHPLTDDIGGDSSVVAVVENTNMQRADHELLPNVQAQQQQMSNVCANAPLTPEAAGDFPQMPAAVKMELKEDLESENEANFRNFFSQYRASLNLLYERH